MAIEVDEFAKEFFQEILSEADAVGHIKVSTAAAG